MFGGVVHPVGIGGQKNIGRRTLVDLLGQHGACRIACNDLDAGLGGVSGVDVVERILHRGRGKYGQGFFLGERSRGGKAAYDREGDKNFDKPVHGSAPRPNAALRGARHQALVNPEMRQSESAVPLLPPAYGRWELR